MQLYKRIDSQHVVKCVDYEVQQLAAGESQVLALFPAYRNGTLQDQFA